jgi:hypothetical protein
MSRLTGYERQQERPMRLGDDENDGGDHDGQDASWVAIGPAILATSVMLVGCVVTFLLLNLDMLRPKIGDMVVFRPNTPAQDVWEIRVSTYRPTASGPTSCAMDPATILQQGGSLVVEARDDATPSAQYLVHWAGAHTAKGVGDCPGSADIAVSRADLQRLANAAGGFGLRLRSVR